jgi:hypothetical protein
MSKPTYKDRMEALREKLKDNPQALAELEVWDYKNKTDYYLKKSGQEAGKIARLNRHFLRA